jgi:hypothetical protein
MPFNYKGMEWKTIEINNNYEISNEGDVRNKKTQKILKYCIDNSGYKYVGLGSKIRHQKIHRLVAQTFIINTNNELQVDHIDRNKLNNNVNNLRWVTCQQNSWNSKLVIDAKNIREWKLKNNNKIYTYYKVNYSIGLNTNHEKSFNSLDKAIQYLKEIKLKYPRII